MFKNWKKVAVLALVTLASTAGAQSTGFAAGDITTASTGAVTASLPMIAAAGVGALALWSARVPIRIGLGFLRSLFK